VGYFAIVAMEEKLMEDGEVAVQRGLYPRGLLLKLPSFPLS
jgi:hypothetical protein